MHITCTVSPRHVHVRTGGAMNVERTLMKEVYGASASAHSCLQVRCRTGAADVPYTVAEPQPTAAC